MNCIETRPTACLCVYVGSLWERLLLSRIVLEASRTDAVYRAFMPEEKNPRSNVERTVRLILMFRRALFGKHTSRPQNSRSDCVALRVRHMF